MKKQDPDRTAPFYGSKEGNDITILLECKAVIEKKDFVAAGTITYAHGDIIEIELPQYNNFDLKEPVKVIVYSRSGMFVFETTVVAKSDHSLIIINPPENRNKFTEKREHPRVEVKHKGLLNSIEDRSGKKTLDNPIQVAVSNISMSGAGFMLNFDLGIASGTELAVEFDLGFPLACKAELVRKTKTEHGFFYGTRFINMPAISGNALRAFVLRKQIEIYFRQKQIDRQKALLESKSAATNG